jgi:hypothetical protein
VDRRDTEKTGIVPRQGSLNDDEPMQSAAHAHKFTSVAASKATFTIGGHGGEAKATWTD